MKAHTLALATFTLCSWGAAAEPAPERLTDANLTQVRDYVRGDTAEAAYLKVDWKWNVLDGQRAAVAQDKPILLWLYFGGPLGNC